MFSYCIQHQNSKIALILRPSSSPSKENLLKSATSASERSALEILFKSNSSTKELAVPSQRSFEILKLLSGSGRLLWEDKKVVVDPFSNFDVYFESEPREEQKLQISAKWKLGSQTGEIDQCALLFLGPPSWILHEGIIRQVDEEVSIAWLRKVAQGPALLDAKMAVEFLEEHSIVQQAEPIPLLKLHDRHGAFADLWFDYGSLGQIAAVDPAAPSWRNKESEKGWERDLLETDFIRKIVDRSHYFCPLDKVAKSLTFLLEIGWKIYDAKGRALCRKTGEEIDAQMEQQRLHIRAKLCYEGYETNLSEVVGAFNRRESFIELSPHAVALIDRESMKAQWGDLLEEEVISEGIAIPKRNFGLLSSFFDSPFPDELKQKIQSLAQLAPSTPVQVGKNFLATLFSYQNEGLQWLKFLEEGGLGGLLADEMGLGKTVQVLAFFSQLVIQRPCLIVVPTSLLFHWKREFERFLPSRNVHVHTGKERQIPPESAEVILTSYSILRLDASLLQSLHYQCIVLDEGQTIKNPDSQIAKALYNFKSDMRLIITGTPIENRSDDLWSLFHFLLPDLLGERKDFLAQLSAGQLDRRYLDRVKRKISPFILRRKKDQVALQLPPKLEQTLFVEMEEEQRTVYEQWLQGTRTGLLKKVELEGAAAHRMEILEAILRLRQICAHPALTGHPETSSGKWERLFADLSEVLEEKRKVLVYSQFTQMLKLIEKQVEERGWKYVYLDGSTKDREAVVRQFQEDEETAIFLISLKAGGVGLNLTAADYVFLYDPWWNEAVEQQAIDRAHRVGKQSALIARRYITALSIEEKILRLKSHKKALSESLLEGSDEISSLTTEELLELLE